MFSNLIRMLIMLIIGFLMFIPTELFVLAYYVAGPTGFWQKLAITYLGIAFLGSLQIFTGIVGFAAMISFWLETTD